MFEKAQNNIVPLHFLHTYYNFFYLLYFQINIWKLKIDFRLKMGPNRHYCISIQTFNTALLEEQEEETGVQKKNKSEKNLSGGGIDLIKSEHSSSVIILSYFKQ